MKKKINSRRKGAAIELKAAKFLTSLGYPARRGQQFAGGNDSPDVICDELKHLHFEVKGDRSIGLGTHALQLAIEQSERDAPLLTRPVVFWWEHKKGWRLTTRMCGLVITLGTDVDIAGYIGASKGWATRKEATDAQAA